MPAGLRTCRCWRRRWPEHVDGGDGAAPERGGSRRTTLIVGAAAVVAAAAGAAVFLARPEPAPRPSPSLSPGPADGAERERIAALIAQMNDAEITTRRAATARLLAEHRQSPLAVGLAVDQLSEASFQRLGKEGRVNVLTFLVESDLSAWNAGHRGEARAAVARIHGRLAAGQATLGPQIVELLRRLDERLDGRRPAS